jgi:hypothetical protein
LPIAGTPQEFAHEPRFAAAVGILPEFASDFVSSGIGSDNLATNDIVFNNAMFNDAMFNGDAFLGVFFDRSLCFASGIPAGIVNGITIFGGGQLRRR